MTEATTHPLKKRLLFLGKVALTVLILYFVFQQISKHWQEIKDYPWQIDWVMIGLSLVVGLLTFLALATMWKVLIGRMGHGISLAKSYKIFYLSNLGRYVPGKIWQLAGILYLAKKEDIPPEDATASFILIQLFAVPASFLVFILASQWEPRVLVDQVALFGDYSAYVMTAFMLALAAVIILFPGKIIATGNLLLRKLRRPEVTFDPDKKVALAVFLGYSVAWIGYGVAFWLFVRAVVPDTDLGLVAAVGIFNAAYQIGYLALFAPGGFGPRELVLQVLLVPFVGPIAPALAVLARLWAIALEGIAAVAALLIRK